MSVLTSKIKDHPFKPCFHSIWVAEALGLCLCPDGPNRCHVKGCGKKLVEHEESESLPAEAKLSDYD